MQTGAIPALGISAKFRAVIGLRRTGSRPNRGPGRVRRMRRPVYGMVAGLQSVRAGPRQRGIGGRVRGLVGRATSARQVPFRAQGLPDHCGTWYYDPGQITRVHLLDARSN